MKYYTYSGKSPNRENIASRVNWHSFFSLAWLSSLQFTEQRIVEKKLGVIESFREDLKAGFLGSRAMRWGSISNNAWDDTIFFSTGRSTLRR